MSRKLLILPLLAAASFLLIVAMSSSGNAVLNLHAWVTDGNRLVTGIVLIVVPIVLAYPAHYFLTVRRTTTGGVVAVSGFVDYTFYLVARITIWALLNGSVVYGLLVLVGF